jgi:hypothetical protein
LPGYQDWQPQTSEQMAQQAEYMNSLQGTPSPIPMNLGAASVNTQAGRNRLLNNGKPYELQNPPGGFQLPTNTPMAFQYQFQAPNAQQFASAVQQALQYNQNGVASGDLASVLPHVVPANAVGAFTADQMTTYGYIQNPATGQWLLSGTQGGNTQNPGTFTAAQVQGMVDEALGTYVPYYHDQNALNPLGTSAGGGGGGEVTFAPTGKWAINDAVMSMRVSK